MRRGAGLGMLLLALVSLRADAVHGAPPGVVGVSVPDLRAWESRMTEFGAKYRDERQRGVDEQAVWYYDGQRVFYQIADYTGDAAWTEHARNAGDTYREYVLKTPRVGGWRIFPHGLLMHYRRTGNEDSRRAALHLARTAAFTDRGGALGYPRETAYVLMAYLVAEELGEPRHPKVERAVATALQQLEEYFVTKRADYLQPFMVGLLCEALIQYAETTRDPRVRPALATAADGLWENAWIESAGAFYYERQHPYDPATKPRAGAPDLNLLIVPVYGWLYRETLEPRFRERGDAIFAAGVRGAWLDGGKQFSQNYRWSFDYVKWRREGDLRLK